jgi:phage-related protein
LYALDPSEAANRLGDVAGAATDVAEAAGGGTQAQITTLGRAFQDSLASALVTVAPLLNILLKVITPLAPILGPLAIAIGIITIAQWLWNAALMASPITWIILGIVALIAAIVLLVVHWDTVSAAIGIAWDWIVEKTSAAWDWIVEKLGAVWGWIKDTASSIWGGIAGFFIGLWETVSGFFVGIWNSILNFLKGVWASITLQVQLGANGVLAAIDWLKSLPGKVGGWFQGVYDSAKEKLNSLVDWVKDIPGKITDALGSLKDLLFSAGADILEGLLEGIESMWNSVQSKFSELTSSIPDWKGPKAVDQRLLYNEGRWIIGSLEDGMDDEIPGVEGLLSGLTHDIGISVRPPSAVDAAAHTSDGSGTAPLVVQGPLIAVDNLTVDSDERVGELAQALWARASRADRAQGQVLLEGATL